MTNILVSAHADGQFEHAVYGAPRSRRPLNVHWRELERTAGTNLLYIRVTKSAAFSQLIFSGLAFDGLWGFDPLPPLPEKRDECGPRVTRRAVVTWQPGPFRNPKQAACAQASGTRREGGAPLSCEMLATRRHTSSYGVKPGSRSPSRRHRRTGSFSPHLGRPRSAPKECLNLECGETPFGWPVCHAALLATQTTRVEKDQACAGRAAANQQDSAGKWENAKLQESDGLACGSCAKLDVRTSPKSPSHLPHLRSHSSPGESDVGKPERRETRRVVAAKSLGGKKSPRKVQGAQPF